MPFLLFQAQPGVVDECGLRYAFDLAKKYENTWYSTENETEAHEILLAMILRDDLVGVQNRQLKALQKANLATTDNLKKTIERMKSKYPRSHHHCKQWFVMKSPSYGEVTVRDRLPCLHEEIERLIEW
jgi:hypothetical protein